MYTRWWLALISINSARTLTYAETSYDSSKVVGGYCFQG
ncbi:hypothetical protein ABFS83_01G092600 [Erythranthe nasuta]